MQKILPDWWPFIPCDGGTCMAQSST